MINKIKKAAALFLASVFMLSCVACGNNKADNTSASTSAQGGTVMDAYGNSTELLSMIWNAFPAEDKFPVNGGDESYMSMDGPAPYSIADAEVLDNVLGFPAAQIDKIDDAASFMNAMNQNTFTCAAYRFRSPDDMEAGIAALKKNILARRWICGFPDSLLIISVPRNYVIAVWGIDEGTGTVTKFKEAAKNAVNGAQVIVDEPII